MAFKVGMVSLGCPKNQMDAEQMLARLREAGIELTADAGQADEMCIRDSVKTVSPLRRIRTRQLFTLIHIPLPIPDRNAILDHKR